MNRIATSVALLCLIGGCEAAIIHFNVPLPDTDDAGAPPPVPPGETVTFHSRIQTDIESAGCLGCHMNGTIPMQLLDGPATDAEWRENYDAVAARTDGSASSLLMRKAAGGSGHPPILDAESAIVQRWEAWVEDGAPFDEGTEPPPPPPMDDAGRGPSDAGTEPVDPPPVDDTITWTDDVDALIDRNGCRNCHGDRGGYSLETMGDAMLTGSDATPNVLPGDPGSLLITYARDGHQGIGYRDALMLLAWIVDWDARAE